MRILRIYMPGIGCYGPIATYCAGTDAELTKDILEHHDKAANWSLTTIGLVAIVTLPNGIQRTYRGMPFSEEVRP